MAQEPKDIDALIAEIKAGVEANPDPYGRRWDGPEEQWVENLEDWGQIFDTMRDLHRIFPDMRFGQLVSYLAGSAGTVRSGDVYGVPDPHFLRSARRFLAAQHERLGRESSDGDASERDEQTHARPRQHDDPRRSRNGHAAQAQAAAAESR